MHNSRFLMVFFKIESQRCTAVSAVKSSFQRPLSRFGGSRSHFIIYRHQILGNVQCIYFPLRVMGLLQQSVQFLFYFLYFLQMVYEKLVEKLCSFSWNIWSNSWKKVDTVPHILGILNLLQLRLSVCHIYCPLKEFKCFLTKL